MQMLEVRLKTNFGTALCRGTRCWPESHESGPAPKSQWRGDPCVPCRPLPVNSVSAWSPKAFLVHSYGSNQSSRNFHKRSVAISWLSDKSSFPNSCIFPSCRLSQEHSLLKISPYCWKKLLAVHSPVSSPVHLPQLGVEPGALDSEEPPKSRSRLSPLDIQGLLPKLLGQVRLHTEALELCVMALDGMVQKCPVAPLLLVVARRPRRSAATRASVDLASLQK